MKIDRATASRRRSGSREAPRGAPVRPGGVVSALGGGVTITRAGGIDGALRRHVRQRRDGLRDPHGRLRLRRGRYRIRCERGAGRGRVRRWARLRPPLPDQAGPWPRSAAEGASGARLPAVGRALRPPPWNDAALASPSVIPTRFRGNAGEGGAALPGVVNSRRLAHTLSRASAVRGVAAGAGRVALGQRTGDAGAPDGGAARVVRRMHLQCGRERRRELRRAGPLTCHLDRELRAAARLAGDALTAGLARRGIVAGLLPRRLRCSTV